MSVQLFFKLRFCNLCLGSSLLHCCQFLLNFCKIFLVLVPVALHVFQFFFKVSNLLCLLDEFCFQRFFCGHLLCCFLLLFFERVIHGGKFICNFLPFSL